MNRLWVRLSLAFGLVILVTVGVIAVLAGLTAGQEFHRYLAYSDTWPNQALVDQLASYYRQHQGWQGVETILEWEMSSPNPRFNTRQGRGPGALRMILADAEGRVVYDRDGPLGRKLDADEQAAARAIEVEGEMVGQLVIVVPTPPDMAGPLEQWFVGRLQWWLAIGALLAGALGLLLGVILSRGLTAPLRHMANAARGVAARDFSHRVKEGGSAELNEVAQAFNQMTSALAESERQRQNMVADVAHELRTPLTVVQGSLQAILDDVYPLDKAEISRLYDETRLLNRLVDDLRELALVDAGQLRLNLQPVAAADLIQSTVASLELAAEAKGVALSADVPAELPAIQADPDRLAQVLHNLLVNALRHTPAGGAVTVAAAAGPTAVEVTVADTGEGIAAEDLPHIFERFWRADRSRTRDRQLAGGSGLGLAVAQSLVEAQGGRIGVESAAGRGATFRFTVPYAGRSAS